MFEDAVRQAREARRIEMQDASCSKCAYFESSYGDLGYCRRRPPVIAVRARLTDQGGDVVSTWPEVGKSDWCGEYEISF